MENLFRYHYRPLCIFALHYLKDIDVSEDVVQEAFGLLWEKLSAGEKVVNQKGYLYSIVKNRSLDILRKGGLTGEAISLDGSVDDIEEPAVEDAEVEARLWTAIDTLPEKCREIFLMSKRDGLKQEEIAQELGISLQTVKNQVSKALKILKDGAVKIYTFFV
ncbi:MAG: RNA polymerase sigma-70 factor [Bacteroidales bacterium]|nr:RNA polymerase sigma-70 factor [Bacteroidales bacterium]MBO7321586.1 RNA polymerase sigma-70 factor [Bacteroidales bacterium]